MTRAGTVCRMRTATIAATAALLLTGVFAAPAAAAPRTGLTAAQLTQIHDCHPMYTTPTRPVMGWLMDNLATPQLETIYVRSHGMALFGRYQKVRYCYR